MLSAHSTKASRREKANAAGLGGAPNAVPGKEASEAGGSGNANNDDLPLAIQTFLWRQTR